jgi:hypothetical protein
MPYRMWLFADQRLRNLCRLRNAHDEDSLPRLRDEMARINHGCARAHAQPIEGRDDGLELLAAVDGEKARDVL